MSYTLLSETLRKARKEHRCIWCPEKINAGEQYQDERSVYDGQMQDHKWHPECLVAAKEFFIIERDAEFMPHEFDRGTHDEAGTKRSATPSTPVATIKEQ
jgi:hypothetical protein